MEAPMQEMIEIKEEQEKVILVAVDITGSDETIKSLDELEELADTAGALTVGRLVQKREAPSSGTYLGKGKIDELNDMILESGATGIICDDELSPAQMRNLEEALRTKIMDRTMLILDIFAGHATTAEGKLQVEAAQLKYRLARLVGMRSSMSRVSYGIGMRGPGEKKLEMDRRFIRDRIAHLNEELKTVELNRGINREKRIKGGVPVAAIVGYTNAGKSTLLNRLTGASILAADMLFATLDPTTRSFKLENGQELLLTDTVGFIRKLPHHLIEAFHSTLEEARFADIIIHVCDYSSPDCETRMKVVYETLGRLGIKDKPVVTVFNKTDLVIEKQTIRDFNAEKCVEVSAVNGDGIGELLKALEEILLRKKVYLDTVVDFKNAGIIQQIRKDGVLLEEEYIPEGVRIRAYISRELYGRINDKLV